MFPTYGGSFEPTGAAALLHAGEAMNHPDAWELALTRPVLLKHRAAVCACLSRLDIRESNALEAASIVAGHQRLPKPYLRSQLRVWFNARRYYLLDLVVELESKINKAPE